jgi:hypothetical protein
MKRSKSVVAIIVAVFLLSSSSSFAAPKKIAANTPSPPRKPIWKALTIRALSISSPDPLAQ